MGLVWYGFGLGVDVTGWYAVRLVLCAVLEVGDLVVV